MRAIFVALVLLLVPLAAAQNTSTCAATGDRDGDCLPDRWEQDHFGNLRQTAAGDPDRDDYTNGQEYAAWTDPNDASSHPQADGGPEGNRSGSPSGNPGNPRQGARDDQSGAANGSQADKNSTPPDRRTDQNGQRGTDTQDLRDSCRGNSNQRDCAASYCETRPDNQRCANFVKDACRDGRLACAALSEKCVRATVADILGDRAIAVCEQLSKVDDVRIDARHIGFDVDREGHALVNYTVDGTVLFSRIEYGDDQSEFTVRQDGARIRFQTDDSRLEIHDTRGGDFWYRTESDAPLRLVLAPGTTTSVAPNGLLLQIGDLNYRLAGAALEVSNDAIMLNNHTTFFRVGEGQGHLADAVEAAKANGQVGAAVRFGDGSSQERVTAYDDVGVHVSEPELITADTPLRVTVNATLAEGRTISIDIEGARLGGPELDLAYFDVNDDGTETEIVFRMAGSIEDVLDATDDAGQPEYWVIEDETGVHVLASVPYWSTHIIQISSIGEFLREPSVLIGIAAGVMGVGIASIAMFLPRRRDAYET